MHDIISWLIVAPRLTLPTLTIRMYTFYEVVLFVSPPSLVHFAFCFRPAWGGTNYTNATPPTKPLVSMNINLLDTWAPLIIVAADPNVYGTLENFTQHVLAAPVTVNAKRTHVDFVWHGRRFGFTPGTVHARHATMHCTRLPPTRHHCLC